MACASFALLSLVACAHASAQAPAPSALRFYNEQAGCEKRIALPAPSGPFAVGAVSFHWVDPTEKEPRTAAPDDLRQYMATLFYPAAATQAAPRAYVPELGMMLGGFQAMGHPGPRSTGDYASRFGCIDTHTHASPPLDTAQAPYPVLMIASGGDMSRHWYTALAQELSSNGYVVAVLSHPHSGLDVLPIGGLVTKDAYYEESDPALNDELTDRLTQDALFVLDRLEELGAGNGPSRFAGRLDLARLAILGHSRGSRAVVRGCASDSRFRACVIWDALGPPEERAAGLSQPHLTIRAPWNAGRTEQLTAFLSRNRSAAYDVLLREANHFTFSDLPIVVPERFASKVASAQGHRLVSDYALAFLGKYLHGRPAPLLDDEAQRSPEVSVRRFGPAD